MKGYSRRAQLISKLDPPIGASARIDRILSLFSAASSSLDQLAKTHQETLLVLEEDAAPPPDEQELLEDPIVKEEEIVENWMTKNLCANPSS